MRIEHPTAFPSWGWEERAAINRVIESGRFTMGEEVEAFEAEFATFHGKRHAIMVNSGSSANLVAIAALGRPDTARAIVPAMAWATTYAPLVQYGYDLTLADCDETWNAPDFEPGDADVVIACSILGNPGYLREWQAQAEFAGSVLIEDNCESLGAYTPEGQLCGTYGLMSTFSFFWSHQVSAIEGGMILTDDDERACLCRMLRDHGMTRGVQKATRFESEYDFLMFGYNVRPLEMHAAIARAQIKKLPAFRTARRCNQETFELLAKARDLPVTFPLWRGAQSPFGLSFLCETEEARSRAVAGLRRAGIDCRLPTGGSFRLHAYGAPWRAQATPGADDIHRRGLFLGNAPYDITPLLERAVFELGEALAMVPA